MKEVPEGLVESEHGMSNFDHAIDDGMAEDLVAGKVGYYAGWNFHGTVWFAGGKFYCMVRCYQVHVATVEADTLDGIMDEVSSRWGEY